MAKSPNQESKANKTKSPGNDKTEPIVKKWEFIAIIVIIIGGICYIVFGKMGQTKKNDSAYIIDRFPQFSVGETVTTSNFNVTVNSSNVKNVGSKSYLSLNITLKNISNVEQEISSNMFNVINVDSEVMKHLEYNTTFDGVINKEQEIIVEYIAEIPTGVGNYQLQFNIQFFGNTFLVKL